MGSESQEPSRAWWLFLIVLVSGLPGPAASGQQGEAAAMSSVQIPDPVDPELVVVDHSEPAYAVFMAVPTDMPQEELEELRSQLGERENVELVPWKEFLEKKSRLVDSRILKDEYPGSRAREGIGEVLRRYPKTPIGLTWNGGIAMSFNDYEHAKRMYKAYRADPEAYARRKPEDPAADPVNPRAHLGPLLGWNSRG